MKYSNGDQRRQAQLTFIQSQQELTVGAEANLPLSVDELLRIDETAPEVVEVFRGGLTAVVYHLHIDGQHWNLKRKRPESRVKNIDGHTSFLNEVQRRVDITKLKNDPAEAPYYRHVVETVYASFQQGIIVSPWIEGPIAREFDAVHIANLFETLFHLERAGLMEWDLCPGNLLAANGAITLFDFGYMYRFNPLIEYNSEGLAFPVFHSIERFETRAYFPYLLKHEKTKHPVEIMTEYRQEKELALASYQRRHKWLVENQAAGEVLDWNSKIIARWADGLSSPAKLDDLFRIESFRSCVLDLGDDLMGQSCTPATLTKVDRILDDIRTHYQLLKKKDAFLWDDVGASPQTLIKRYEDKRKLAEKWQVD